MSQKTKSLIFDVFIYLIAVIISILMFYPFMYIFAVSLSDPAEIYGKNITIYPKGFSLDLYKYIFQLPTVYNGYLNSILYTVIGTIMSIIITLLCAYPLSKPWLYGRSAIVIFIITTMFVSGGLVPLFIVIKALGIYNTMWALILPYIMNTFFMFIALAFLRTIPLDLEEASYIDGGGDVAIFFKVYLPLSKPIIATLALFYAVSFWNAWFPAALFLNDTGKYPIQLVLRNVMNGMGVGQQEMTSVLGDLLNRGSFNVTALNYALIVAVIGPIILLYPFVQKYFIKGAMIGSLKG